MVKIMASSKKTETFRQAIDLVQVLGIKEAADRAAQSTRRQDIRGIEK